MLHRQLLRLQTQAWVDRLVGLSSCQSQQDRGLRPEARGTGAALPMRHGDNEADACSSGTCVRAYGRACVCAYMRSSSSQHLTVWSYSCGNLISNAFGSLIASGILSNMDGVLGHAAWRWVRFTPTMRRNTALISSQSAVLHRGRADDLRRYMRNVHPPGLPNHNAMAY